MRNLLWALLLAPTVSCGIFQSSPCKETCRYYTDCMLEQLDDAGLDCEYEDDESEFFNACMEACTDEYDDLDKGERSEVRDCVRCMYAEIGDSCDAEDYFDAYEDCEDVCDDNDVEDFFIEFEEEAFEDLDDYLECDYD